jgi:hypothetical protein
VALQGGQGRSRQGAVYGTKSGKPIGQQPLARHKAEEIRAELQKGTGILKTARLCGTGVSAVQRIKAVIKEAAWFVDTGFGHRPAERLDNADAPGDEVGHLIAHLGSS